MSTILQLAGLAVLAVGAGLIFIPAGICVAGVGLVLIGMALED